MTPIVDDPVCEQFRYNPVSGFLSVDVGNCIGLECVIAGSTPRVGLDGCFSKRKDCIVRVDVVRQRTQTIDEFLREVRTRRHSKFLHVISESFTLMSAALLRTVAASVSIAGLLASESLRSCSISAGLPLAASPALGLSTVSLGTL